MIKCICDRCNNEITGDIYRVKIYTEPKKKSFWDEINDAVTSATATTNVNACYVELPMYCKECKEKIERFIACDV